MARRIRTRPREQTPPWRWRAGTECRGGRQVEVPVLIAHDQPASVSAAPVDAARLAGCGVGRQVRSDAVTRVDPATAEHERVEAQPLERDPGEVTGHRQLAGPDIAARRDQPHGLVVREFLPTAQAQRQHLDHPARAVPARPPVPLSRRGSLSRRLLAAAPSTPAAQRWPAGFSATASTPSTTIAHPSTCALSCARRQGTWTRPGGEAHRREGVRLDQRG
jgi:hypothetical protein